MRVARPLFVCVLASAGVTAIACQEPTQVTLDLRLATAQCREVHGTALNVGIQPLDTEEKVKSRFPTAQTSDCDPATNAIGTLVVTPSDEERAALVVVASYGNRQDPTECQPPDYVDCIVARRRFSFTKHRRLSLPITIDPTCVNVPCDAFSTCRKGFCFDAEVAPCDGADDCLEPGETAGGGTNPDASVPDVAPVDGQARREASCQGTTLVCGAMSCGAPSHCCESPQVGVVCSSEPCAGSQYCCTSDDCGGVGCLQKDGTLSNIPDASGDFDSGDGGQPGFDSGSFDSGSFDSGGFDSGGFDSGGSDSGAGFDSGGGGSDGGRRAGLGVCKP